MISINLFWIVVILSALGIFIIIFIYHNLLKTSRKETGDLIEAIEKNFKSKGSNPYKRFLVMRVVNRIKGEGK